MLVAHSLTHLLSVQPFASSAFDTSRISIVSSALKSILCGTTPTYATLRSAGRMTTTFRFLRGFEELLLAPLKCLLLFIIRC